MFSSYAGFEVGNGANVRFWCDLWCGDKALKEAFPNLYGICLRKGCFRGRSLGVFCVSN